MLRLQKYIKFCFFKHFSTKMSYFFSYLMFLAKYSTFMQFKNDCKILFNWIVTDLAWRSKKGNLIFVMC